jgi:hypothetical protein
MWYGIGYNLRWFVGALGYLVSDPLVFGWFFSNLAPYWNVFNLNLIDIEGRMSHTHYGIIDFFFFFSFSFFIEGQSPRIPTRS